MKRRRPDWGTKFVRTALIGGALLALSPPASAEPSGYKRVGYLGLLQQSGGQTPVRLEGEYWRQPVIAELRAAGLNVLPANVPVDERSHPPLLLGGVVEQLECEVREQKLNCRAGIHWYLRDARDGKVIYQTVTRVAEYDVGRSKVGEVSQEMLEDSVASLVSRAAFKQAQVDEVRESPTFSPATYQRCALPSPKLPAQADEATHATVVITSRYGIGSGFFLNEQGLILTAAHVADAPFLQVRLRDGSVHSVGVVRIHAQADVALLRVELPQPVRCLDTSAKAPTLGSDIYAIGAPHGANQAFSLSRGIVSGLREMEGLRVLQTDAAVSPGNSGGPLLGPDGKAVGVVSFKVIDEGVEGVGYGVFIEAALQALALTQAASTSVELATVLPPVVPPTPVWDPDDALPELEPPAPPRTMAAPAGEREADRQPANEATTPAYITAMQWGGLAITLTGLVMVAKSELDYEPDSTTKKEFSSLATLNDVGWTLTLLGGATVGAAFVLKSRPGVSSSQTVKTQNGSGFSLHVAGSF